MGIICFVGFVRMGEVGILFLDAIDDWKYAGSKLNLSYNFGGGGDIFIGGSDFGNAGNPERTLCSQQDDVNGVNNLY
ncbi:MULTISPECIES: hypothetical protein [unclassified Paenibacillus]|uniref:hypothetical protein n=1 Tax=unclassified Paenibacillus TaxID=185978 RepID=UPI00119FF974|nr:hypothetical protein [Paenibacillus sp. 32O-W]